MILDGGPLISRACRGGTGPNVALGLVPRIGPQPIAKGLTTKTEPKLSKISVGSSQYAPSLAVDHIPNDG